MSQPSPEFLITDSIAAVREAVASACRNGERIGCVMTMGALHEGHLTLIRTAAAECGFVVVTIFVNPTQFAPGEDFDAYPRPLKRDLALCREAGADAVFTPSSGALYPDGFQTYVTTEEVTQPLEGQSRPTHFRGVTTVVLKLLNIVQPDAAYFGQKDYQQQAVLRRMAADLNVPTEIRTVPTVREADGLAMSSRNAYLSPEERSAATVLSQALAAAAAEWAESESAAAAEDVLRETLAAEPMAEIDYAVVVDAETLTAPARSIPVALLAVRIGSTRLIDNHRLGDPVTWETHHLAP